MTIEGKLLILKPEKASTTRTLCRNFIQSLTTFKEILVQNSPDPLANSRLAFEQLRKSLTDGSDLLFLMRDIRDNPSPLIDALLTLKEATEAKGPVISIKTSEEIKPLIKHILSRIDDFRSVLISLEKKVGEMKQIMRELQEEVSETLSGRPCRTNTTDKSKDEKKDVSLSNFKAKGNSKDL